MDEEKNASVVEKVVGALEKNITAEQSRVAAAEAKAEEVAKRALSLPSYKHTTPQKDLMPGVIADVLSEVMAQSPRGYQNIPSLSELEGEEQTERDQQAQQSQQQAQDLEQEAREIMQHVQKLELEQQAQQAEEAKETQQVEEVEEAEEAEEAEQTEKTEESQQAEEVEQAPRLEKKDSGEIDLDQSMFAEVDSLLDPEVSMQRARDELQLSTSSGGGADENGYDEKKESGEKKGGAKKGGITAGEGAASAGVDGSPWAVAVNACINEWHERDVVNVDEKWRGDLLKNRKITSLELSSRSKDLAKAKAGTSAMNFPLKWKGPEILLAEMRSRGAKEVPTDTVSERGGPYDCLLTSLTCPMLAPYYSPHRTPTILLTAPYTHHTTHRTVHPPCYSPHRTPTMLLTAPYTHHATHRTVHPIILLHPPYYSPHRTPIRITSPSMYGTHSCPRGRSC
jgi:hypothetical protein